MARFPDAEFFAPARLERRSDPTMLAPETRLPSPPNAKGATSTHGRIDSRTVPVGIRRAEQHHSLTRPGRALLKASLRRPVPFPISSPTSDNAQRTMGVPKNTRLVLIIVPPIARLRSNEGAEKRVRGNNAE